MLNVEFSIYLNLYVFSTYTTRWRHILHSCVGVRKEWTGAEFMQIAS